MPTDSKNWISQKVANRYTIAKLLGEGGMAFALLARDEISGNNVVVKIPKPILLADSEFALRFDREIRSMSALAHPHVIPIIDRGTHDGLPFYVMELKPGGNLEDRFQLQPKAAKTPMPAASLANWLTAIAKALDYIHGRRFVHRDVKPSNILFDRQGNAFLSDFGIVKVLSDGADANAKATVMTQAGMVIGTAPYVAPEIIQGKTYDGRADQYSLAVTVYETLTGRVPYEGTNLAAIAVKQAAGKFPPVHEIISKIPKSLSRSVERGLHHDPAKRFPNCVAFADDVLAAAIASVATVEANAPVSNAGQDSVSSKGLRGKSSVVLNSHGKGPPPLPPMTPPPLPKLQPPPLPTVSRGEPLRQSLSRIPSLVWIGAGGLALLLILVTLGVALFGNSSRMGEREKARNELKSDFK